MAFAAAAAETVGLMMAVAATSKRVQPLVCGNCILLRRASLRRKRPWAGRPETFVKPISIAVVVSVLLPGGVSHWFDDRYHHGLDNRHPAKCPSIRCIHPTAKRNTTPPRRHHPPPTPTTKGYFDLWSPVKRIPVQDVNCNEGRFFGACPRLRRPIACFAQA